jgi:hypothetical protein
MLVLGRDLDVDLGKTSVNIWRVIDAFCDVRVEKSTNSRESLEKHGASRIG